MAEGLQVWDENGSVLVDGATRMSSVLGIVSITAAGSLSNADLAKGTPWYVVNNPDRLGRGIRVTVSGTTISWTVTTLGTPSGPSQLIYGVY